MKCQVLFALKNSKKKIKQEQSFQRKQMFPYQVCSSSALLLKDKKSAEGVIAPAGAKVTGATIRMWLLNKFISFLAVLSWKTGLKKNEDKVPSRAHIFQASAIPSNGYIFSTDFSYYTAQW